jgi:putative hydrolase of the HAD superfamily
MTVRAVLWDADGVLQVLPPFDLMWPFLPEDTRAALLAEVFGDLGSALTGHLDMSLHLDAVFGRHRLDAHHQQIRAVFAQLDPVLEGRAALAAVRASGVTCVLATNQDTLRTAHMRPVYEPLVDRCYFSAEVGLAKPDPAYFLHIAGDLRLEVEELLLIDDGRDNIAAARTLGLRAEWWHHDAGVPLAEVLGRHGISVTMAR